MNSNNMISVYCRVVAKFFTFFCISFFVVFFVVYGFRYEKNVGFVKQNAFVEINFWSDDNIVELDEQTYLPSNKKVSLYNLDYSCYDLKLGGKETKVCLDDDKPNYFGYINLIGEEKIENFKNYNYDSLDYLEFDGNCVSDVCFSSEIKNVFNYNGFNFVKFPNSLYYCGHKYSYCTKLTDLKGEPVYASEKGIIFYDGEYSIINLK